MKRKNPDTSKEAYKSLKSEDIRALYRKIMLSLSAIGSGTFEDIAAHAKESRERIWKRLSEMEDMGLIYKPGTKKVLKSGRQGYCWSLTGTHLPKTQAAEKALEGKSVADFSRDIQKIKQEVTQGSIF